ncbi:TetR/AcrR family transcriptional regulator [Polynucleobacter sp. AP-Capit-er-40B-B4]|uniref:TetR/AcrR family transcriptional regulator n=1 Tax=Polynucleobacter sp. AP-Capit-er-40B-B4 TaxID=2576927 RepID=UPI001C0CBC64|nr:TetR/AcrR family transcriptional regulator [Polynucleobacter sp. AP-Capit-er-40B-B4]MBU3581347.1 TetR/AcrR family transcriptional regulator [Polynucleobacter sp. AP-Capit-er-40B-B4]
MSTPTIKRNALSKKNSPVVVTGLTSQPKKRLSNAKVNDLAVGRDKILMAARVCFQEQGFVGTSMADIQKASGFSRGNLYHHFKTKEEIIQIIIAQNLGRFGERIDLILALACQQELSLIATITELAAFAEEITTGPGKGIAFHAWSLAMVDKNIRHTMTTFFERIRGALECYILNLQKHGQLPQKLNALNLSVALFGIVIPGFTLQSVFMDEKSINAKEYAQCLRLLLRN